MKKILLLAMALILLVLPLSACKQKAMETNPYDSLPATYEIVYEIRDTDGTVTQCIGGKDADGNVYFRDQNGNEIIFYVAKKIPLTSFLYSKVYDQYVLNPETGAYELVQTESIVSRPAFENLCKTAYNVTRQGTYQMLDTLSLPDSPLFSDPAKFDFYNATTPYGGNCKLAVEKATGICFYAIYENGYTFSIVAYTTPYTGNYADRLGLETDTSDGTDTGIDSDSITDTESGESTSDGAQETASETETQ